MASEKYVCMGVKETDTCYIFIDNRNMNAAHLECVFKFWVSCAYAVPQVHQKYFSSVLKVGASVNYLLYFQSNEANKTSPMA